MEPTERDLFIARTGVSHETLTKLDRYAGLLAEWNLKFNLVAASTIPHLWTRHFLDSAQLVPLLPDEAKVVADLGSGAGFPGLILAIMTGKDVHLIESTGKKADFLRHVIGELGLKAKVHQCRVEDMKGFRPDVITSRALGPLADLFGYASRMLHPGLVCLFLKGRNAGNELTESEKHWTFRCKKIQSLSDESGSVLVIRNLQHKTNAAKHRHR